MTETVTPAAPATPPATPAAPAAAPAAPETPPGTPGTPPATPAAPDPAQERIRALIARNKALEDQLRQQQPQDQQRQKQPPAQGAPRPEDYQTWEEYEDARTEWKIEQRMARESRTRQMNEAKTRYTNSAMELAKKYPDFDTVAYTNPHMSEPMAHTLIALENGAEVAYWLGKNPGESARISMLDPYQQMLAVSAISGRLSAQPPAPPAAPAPNAPEPPTPPRGGGSDAEPDASKDPAAWIRWRNKNLRKRA